ncbi:hypothetical protein VTN49DRAFT_7599 [Thermomyces lanuginosus]|uniref:uncharacterized protein n=1 Tax=Thermomyces lanuginosus TaxID=5541 RepID=UPI003742C293
MASPRRRIDTVFGTPHESSIREGSYDAAETAPFPGQGAGARNVEPHNMEPSEDDDLEQVVMAIDIKESGTVGCSYYVAAEETLYILADVQHGGLEILETLKLEIKPTTVLSSTRADDAVAALQQRPTSRELPFNLPYQLDIRPSQEFNAKAAASKLAALQTSPDNSDTADFLVPGNGLTQHDVTNAENTGFSLDKGKLLRLAGSIDIENKVSLGCVGALITYLQRRRTEYTGPNEGRCGIRYFNTFSLKGTMYISPETLSSLQVLQSESHPNAFNQGPGKASSQAKENFSLYGLFYQHASTSQGKARLRQFFLRPSTQLEVIEERHCMVDMFLQPANAPIFQRLSSIMKRIRNIRPVMANLRKGLNSGRGAFGGLKGTVWDALLIFSFHAIEIRETIRELAWPPVSVSFRDRITEAFDVVAFHRVGRLIHKTVDLKESQEQQRTVINPGIDRELDLLKDRYDGLDSLLRQVALDIASTIPGDLEIDVNVIYFPQIGFNIAIPFNENGDAAYSGDGEGWERIFTTENRVYFKDSRMREMDETMGDIYGMICEREIELAHELVQEVLAYERTLSEASDLCGELDCYLAMAKTASIYRFTRPRMCRENIIRIRGGRHPLQELIVPSFIPNDTDLQGGPMISKDDFEDQTSEGVTLPSPSMLLLTGPNYSGKSIYMKQVALIVLLAHIGSFVPAQSAEIGITDKVLTRITTPETVSKIQSTFMIDLQQVSLILKLATRQSLVIIDEFGKGTDLSDGTGLACGVFEHLLKLDDDRPKVLAATHFHEIFEHGFLRPSPYLAFGHMEIRVDKDAHDDADQVTYLYNFLPGRSNQSFGTFCAATNGIDPAIIARANELAALASRGENLVAACAKLSKTEKATLENAEAIARKFLEMDFTSAGEIDSQDIRQELGRLLFYETGNSTGV